MEGLLVLCQLEGVHFYRFASDAFNNVLAAPIGEFVSQDLLIVPGVVGVHHIFVQDSNTIFIAIARAMNYPSLIYSFSSDGVWAEWQNDLPDAVASFRAFSSGGELYLAAARSPCSSDADCACDDIDVGLASTILQFNRNSKRFGRILAITDKDNKAIRGERVPVANLETNAKALNISAGAAIGWEHIAVDRADYLLLMTRCYQASNATLPTLGNRPVWNGAVLMEWYFDRVEGLLGAAAVIASGSSVYVAATLDGRVSAFRFNGSSEPERLGLYPEEGKLPGIVGARRFAPLYPLPSPTNATKNKTLAPLSQADSIALAAFKLPQVAVNGSVFALLMNLNDGERLCGPFPAEPTPIPGHISPARSRCQILSFVVEQESTDNSGLFLVPPTLDQAGTLTFEPRRAQVYKSLNLPLL
jgi:hypothetical protein